MSTQFFTLAYGENRAIVEANPKMNTGSAVHGAMVMIANVIEETAAGNAEAAQKAAVMLAALACVMFDRNNQEKRKAENFHVQCPCEDCQAKRSGF